MQPGRGLKESVRTVQTSANAEAKQAETRVKHLQKQLAEQRRALGSRDKETAKLQAELSKGQAAVDAVAARY